MLKMLCCSLCFLIVFFAKDILLGIWIAFAMSVYVHAAFDLIRLTK